MSGHTWITRISTLLGIAATAGWLWACYLYLKNQVGLETLVNMLPQEQGQILSGIVLPLFLVWVVLLFIVRGAGLSRQTKQLLLKMERLTYPDDEENTRVKDITRQLKEQAESLNSASSDVEQRLNGVINGFKEQTKQLTGAAIRASSQAEQIQETLASQQNSLEEIHTSIHGSLDTAREAVKEQVTALENSGVRSEVMAEAIGKTLRESVDVLDEAVERTIGRTEDACEMLKQQAEDMAAAGTTAEVCSETMRESLKEDLETLKQVQDTIEAEGERFKGLIKDRIGDVEELLAGASGKVSELGVRLSGENQAMEQLVAEIGYKAVSLSDAMRKDAEEVRELFADVALRAGEMTDRFKIEAGELGKSGQTVAENLTQVTKDLGEAVSLAGREEASRLTAATGQAQETLIAAAEKIRPGIESLEESSERLNDLADVVMGGLSEHTREIGQVSQAAQKSVEETTKSLKDQTRLMELAADKAVRHTTEVAKVFQLQTLALADGASAANQAVQDLRHGVHEELDAFKELSGDFEKLHDEIRSSLNARTDALTKVSEESRQTAESLSKEVEGQREKLMKLADEALAQVEKISGRAETAASGLEGVASTALERAEALTETLRKDIDNVSLMNEKVSTLAETFGQQTRDLIHASEEATRQALVLREDKSSNKRDAFLRGATILIDDLNSSAIDLNKILDADLPEEYWKRYHKGDRSIFARSILKKKDLYDTREVKRYFETNQAFRNQVNRYLDQFDNLMSQARECDSEDVLAATFMTADVGKLYILFSRSLGRME
ncbi:hypothetical protein [Kiloniella antarctica]|uniref:Methyl-accepting transducer domain-containing protein n=1 Tax=Kiloniella antarctica TaxID=1550907 RepID=A0ABW5BLB4_9PROT